jgi:hypothetical protein
MAVAVKPGAEVDGAVQPGFSWGWFQTSTPSPGSARPVLIGGFSLGADAPPSVRSPPTTSKYAENHIGQYIPLVIRPVQVGLPDTIQPTFAAFLGRGHDQPQLPSERSQHRTSHSLARADYGSGNRRNERNGCCPPPRASACTNGAIIWGVPCRFNPAAPRQGRAPALSLGLR